MRKLLIICLILGLGISATYAQLEQNLPIIISFTVDTPTLTLAQVESGTEKATFTWQTLNMTADYGIHLYAYEIGTWVVMNPDPTASLEPVGSLEIMVRHPLNFNPPSYRLIITDAQQQVYSEAIITIPYDTSGASVNPTITSFSVTQTSISADELTYGAGVVEVSWAIANRTPTSNLVFEQVMSDGSVVSVELSRRNLWINSVGAGVVKPTMPDQGTVIALRLKVIDVVTNTILDEAGQQVSVTGTLSTATPAPRNTQPASNNTAPQVTAPPPVANAGTSGGFELGGHIATFGSTATVRAAGMTWIKQQIRWRRGEDAGVAASIINAAHSNGFKVLLGIVGYRDEMGDFEAYTNDFAAYLAQVAALAPDAIEVWNEPNIDREWVAGTINGGNYTAMLAKAFNAIKGANPNVMVISGALAPTGFFGGACTNSGCDDNVFLRQMAAAGATQYMDCVGAHYNEGIISPDQTSGDPRGGHYSRYFLGMLNLYYNTFNGARQVCWTELGYLTPEGFPPLPANFAWAQNTTLAQHAEWLGLAAQRSRETGRVRLMIVWNVDFTVYDSDPQAGFAILRPDGSCPACSTLAAAVQ